MTGGIPVWRKVNVKEKEASLEVEYFIRLYELTSLEPCVEISQNSFDYKCLGTKMTSSSIANIHILADELRNRFSAAIFDDILMSYHRGTRDEIDVKCKLIYLCHRTASGKNVLDLSA